MTLTVQGNLGPKGEQTLWPNAPLTVFESILSSTAVSELVLFRQIVPNLHC